MDITKIEISSFKKIRELALELADINLIIGGNNSGKSSVLQAIHAAVSAAESQIEAEGQTSIAEEALRYSPTGDFSLLGHGVPFGNRADQNRAEIKFTAEVERDGEINEVTYTVQLYRGRNSRNVGVNRAGNPRLGQAISSPEEPFSVYVPGLAGVPHFEELKASPVVLRKLAGGEANLVLRNVLYQLHEQQKLIGLVQDLRAFFPGLSIKVRYNSKRDVHLDVKIRPGYDAPLVPLELCGTGVLQAIQIFAYVALFEPEILLLDEPDSHLHPGNQVKLYQALEFIAEQYGAQILIATHSRHLMNAAQASAKFFWLQDGRIKEDGEIDLANVLMDIGGVDQADVILNSTKEFLFFVEDTKQKPLDMLLRSCDVDPATYDIISYHGVSNAEATAKILNSLKPFLRGERRLIIHRDRDLMLDQEIASWVEIYENHGFTCFVTAGSDLEAYFINPQHIASVTGLTPEQIQEAIELCLQHNEGEIRKRFRSKRREINGKFYKDGGSPQTDELCPHDSPVNLWHVVGKDFCGMFARYAEDHFGRNINPVRPSDVELAPDLSKLLDA